MTKRILAILLAVLLICTAFVGCKKDDAAGKNEPGTPKEQFVDALGSAVIGVPDFSLPTMELSGDLKVDAKIDLNKLSVMGQDYLQKGAVEANVGLALDADNDLFEMSGGLTLGNEAPTVKGVLGKDGMFITDLMGLNSKAIEIPFSEIGMSESEVTEIFDMLDQALSAGNDLLKSMTDSVNKNIPDSAFAAETKDVTVGGTEYKGATVISATLTSAMAENILVDLFNALKENPMFAESMGDDVSADEIKESIPEGQLVLVNTIAEQKTVALDAKLTAEGEELAALEGTFLPTGTKIVLKVEGQDVGVFESKMDGDNVKATVSYNDQGQLLEIATAEGTYIDGKFTGKVKVDMDGEFVAVNCSAKLSETGYELTVTNVDMSSGGMTLSIPMEISIVGSSSDTAETVNIGVKFDYAGMASIDGNIALTVQTADVTIAPVTDAAPLDEAEAATWVTDIQTKYPNIMEWIMGFMQSATTDVLADVA